MDTAQFKQLLQRYQEGSVTNQERIFIEAFYAAFEVRPDVLEHLSADELIKLEQLLYQDLRYKFPVPKRVHRIHFLKTAWVRYAAALLVVLGAATFVYVLNKKEKPSVTQTNPVPVQNDVAPGGNRATLTLADGRKIVLDSTKSGELAREENAIIKKTADGKIVYDPDEKLGAKILYNTMTTPRGGQYQLTLPDGSQVWLNAESSITYPTAFIGKERKVNITGEAYFEVAKDKTKPFRVDIGKAMIEVLGTHFNVNTYKEEPTYNTTLLEGKVKILARDAQNAVHTSLILQPGQQGQLYPRTEKLSLAANPDVEQVMAWKNGLFNFNGANLQTVMKQLERWYDIEVEYRGTPARYRFKGKLQRNLTLSQVLRILGEVEVKFNIQGRKLIVTQ